MYLLNGHFIGDVSKIQTKNYLKVINKNSYAKNI